MIVSINQPAYLPWLGYFDRIDASDIHVILDHVQFEKNSFTNRNKIKTSNGATWLTVPIKTKGKFNDLVINDLEIDNLQRWSKKHLASISQSYSKTPFFDLYFDQIKSVLIKQHTSFIELLDEFNELFFLWLGIETKCLKSSELDVVSKKSDLVLDICTGLGASSYFSGVYGRDYLDMASFEQSGVKVQFHGYKYPIYNQINGDFESGMCILDLLFNHGSNSMDIIRKGRVLMND